MNKIITLFSIFLIGLSLSLQSQDTGLIGEWSFNGGYVDESGNGNNGNINGAKFTSDRFENQDSALVFDGIDDYVLIWDNDILDDSETFSASVWFYTSDLGSINKEDYQPIFNKSGYDYMSDSASYSVYMDGKNINCELFDSSNDKFVKLSTPIKFNTDEWVNYVFTFDKGLLKIYINGKLVQLKNTELQRINNSWTNLLVGCWWYNSSYNHSYFSGKIDDLKLFNTVLDSTDVVDIYNDFGVVNYDCKWVLGGTAYIDNCKNCVGGTTGKTACVQDCSDDWGGSAFLDSCNECVRGFTNKAPCEQDCNGDWGGTAYIDNCKKCVGGNTGETACIPPDSVIYEDWEENKLHKWTDNSIDYYSPEEYPFEVDNPEITGINTSAKCGKYNRYAGDPYLRYFDFISMATPCFLDSLEWCSFDMATYPIISMDVMGEESFSVRLMIKDKTPYVDCDNGACDLEWVDFTYEVEDIGKWKTFVFDFSNRPKDLWPEEVEIQVYFNFGVPKTITVFYDNIIGLSSLETDTTYSISGNVELLGGTNVPTDVSVSITGDKSSTINPDENGNYSFTDLSKGNYVIESSLYGYDFTPESITVSLESDIENQDFIGQLSTSAKYSISGRISILEGSSLPSDATVTLVGDKTFTISPDINGDYNFSDLHAGDYSIYVFLNGYSFNQSVLSFALDSDKTGQNFFGQLTNLTSNYKVYEDWEDDRLNYWTNNLDLTGGDMIWMYSIDNENVDEVNSSAIVGQYERQYGLGVYGFESNVVTAGTQCNEDTLKWCTFDLANYPYMTLDVYSEDTFSVYFVIKDKEAVCGDYYIGTGCNIAEQKRHYGNTGQWETLEFDFSDIPITEWTDTVEIQMWFGYLSSSAFTVLYDNIIGWDTLLLDKYKISGTVTLIDGNKLPSDAIVILSGDRELKVSPDLNGNYSFANLASGNYIIKTSLDGYEFSSDSISINLGSEAINQNFIGQISELTGWNDMYSDNLLLYPNPAKDFIKIDLGTNGIYQYELIDVLGNLVLKSELSDNSIIDLQTVENGIYFLKLENASGNESSISKIIVQK